MDEGLLVEMLLLHCRLSDCDFRGETLHVWQAEVRSEKYAHVVERIAGNILHHRIYENDAGTFPHIRASRVLL